MDISIFRDYPEENFYSMDVYADNLIKNLKSGYPKLRIKEPLALASISKKIGDHGLKTRLFFRFMDFVFSPFSQGSINHIIDQTYSPLLFFLNPSRSIVTCHDLHPFKIKKYQSESCAEDFNFMTYKFGARFLKRAARIIAVSESTKKDLNKILGISEKKIVVVSEGVEDIFKPIKRSSDELKKAKLKYGLPDEFLLHVGQCSDYKNLETTLKVFSQVLKEKSFRNLYFVKVGGEWERSQVVLIKSLGISKRMIKLSFIPRRDLPAIYSMAKCLIHLSFFEGFGLTVLEAMACGCPVICSDTPSLVELTGQAAIHVNLDDKENVVKTTIGFLKNETRQKLIRKKGLKRAKLYSWENCARQTNQVYEEVYRNNQVS